MKIFEFAGQYTPKMSPYIDNLDILVNKAKECVDMDDVEVRQVPINKILFTQPLDVPADHQSVEVFTSYDDLPFAVKLDGYYHLLDGHHRVMTAIEGGQTEILLFVAECEEEMVEEKKKAKKQSTHSPILPFVGRWWYGPSDDRDNDDVPGQGVPDPYGPGAISDGE